MARKLGKTTIDLGDIESIPAETYRDTIGIFAWNNDPIGLPENFAIYWASISDSLPQLLYSLPFKVLKLSSIAEVKIISVTISTFYTELFMFIWLFIGI